jgi:glycosyltransferase involved in cell wall biosynthesis
MTLPLVSVLMTSFNREGYIAQAIESVLAQTMTDFELVVCDDASIDRTVEIARTFEERDSRVRVIVNDRNAGDYPNRNRAATFARGTYIKYHDSDDLMYPHCLAVMTTYLDAAPTAVAAFSGSRHWAGGACPMLVTPALAYEREFLGGGLFHLGPGAALLRRRSFEEHGGFPAAGAASDYLMWLRLCASSNVLLVPGDLFYYRVHAGQELTNARNELDYVRAGAEAWSLLNSPACPLASNACEQAKRNFAYTTLRGAYRKFRAGRFLAAAIALRHGGLTAGEWLRYLRWPHRVASAGTPAAKEVRA